MISTEEPARLNVFIEDNTWKFAKTMPQNPHWYVVRDQVDENEFVWFAEFIRSHGEPRKFWKVTYIYLDVNEFTYWTMGNPIPVTTIINRALIDK